MKMNLSDRLGTTVTVAYHGSRCHAQGNEPLFPRGLPSQSIFSSTRLLSRYQGPPANASSIYVPGTDERFLASDDKGQQRLEPTGKTSMKDVEYKAWYGLWNKQMQTRYTF